MRKIDLTGQTYGFLQVKEKHKKEKFEKPSLYIYFQHTTTELYSILDSFGPIPITFRNFTNSSKSIPD